ncbi:retrovirus-related pol polyprotein from transposon TNT 1-94 [Tanacetum coccineum]
MKTLAFQVKALAFLFLIITCKCQVKHSKEHKEGFKGSSVHVFGQTNMEWLSINVNENGVVERRNRTLVEAARTMLSAFKLPLSFWAEAVATACYTQNRSIIISTHGKTAYHIINDRKPSIKHLHIFGCICYITRDGENLDKMKEKGDPCVMVGYSTQSKGYRVYNKRTRLIVESIHIKRSSSLLSQKGSCFEPRISDSLPSEGKLYRIKKAPRAGYVNFPTSDVQ